MARTKEDATGESTPRGRGRPSLGSAGDGVKKSYVPTGRPRGRPKSDNPKAKSYVPTGRPRGRPKGSGKKKSAGGGVAPAATAASSTPKAASGTGKRGRPRKSDAGETPKVKGKRGRPSKKSLEAQDVADAADLDADADAEPLSDHMDDVADHAMDQDNLAVESGEESDLD
ncbi:hypothetical protein CDD83_5081 [Cordyceps sp. RAO-2017]|nr:hypothetical protein CDD83_5081 [Cordyceps sp. RAO-2017]